MGISVKANLAGCEVVFLVPIDEKRLNALSMKAMDELLNLGIKHVKTITMEEAAKQLAKTQQRHGCVPAKQRFLKVTAKGNIVQLFY